MTVKTPGLIQCDACEATIQITNYKTEDELADKLADANWVEIDDDGNWLCPDCYADELAKDE